MTAIPSQRADSPAAAAAACPTDWHERAGTCYWWSGGYVLAYGGDNLVGVCSQVGIVAPPFKAGPRSPIVIPTWSNTLACIGIK